jgi:hypothetical protein
MREEGVRCMSGLFAHITRCMDLQEGDTVEALGSRATTTALLAHLAAISAPNTGAAKVLLVLSRMATTACDWIDGDLSIELSAGGDATVVEVATELGGGLRERILSPMSFRAPLSEFAKAIERVPHMIAPLAIRTKSPRRVSLSASEALRRTTAPPPPIEISSESLFVVAAPAPLPQQRSETDPPTSASNDIDSGWED